MSLSLHFAEQIAEDVIGQLVPHCELGYCVVAGSVRRRKPTVGDIEIVCIPRTTPSLELFGSVPVRVPGFAAVVDKWERVRGDDKYICRIIHAADPYTPEEGEGVIPVQLDIFTATRRNWGFILAIRTGSAEFSKHLAAAWCANGFHGEGGQLTDDGEVIDVPDEETLFKLCNLHYVYPEDRM